MLEKVLVVLAVIFIFAIAGWMLSSTGLFREIRKTRKSVGNKMKEVRAGTDIEITDPPIISYREPGKRTYIDVVMAKKAFKIGSSPKCDLVLKDAKVERLHAEIVKKIKGGRVAYFVVNHAKVNPVTIYDHEEDTYDSLFPRESIELDKADAFYMGDTKIIVRLEEKKHNPTGTERSLNKRKKSVSEAPETGKRGKKVNSTDKKKRNDSVRIVSRRELDI